MTLTTGDVPCTLVAFTKYCVYSAPWGATSMAWPLVNALPVGVYDQW